MKKLLTLIPIITILVLVASCAPPPAAVAEPATQAPAAEQPAAEQPAVEQPAAEAPSGMYAGLEAAQTGERQQYAYVSYVTGIPYWLDGLAGMEAAAKLLGVDFQFYGPTDLDSQAQAKIVDELVQNAFRFSDPGKRVSVTLSGSPNGVVLSVTDQGRGFSTEHITKVGAYMQFDRKIQEQQGLGLGLVIARRLAELHGGTLSIQSERGTRTTVAVELPRAAAN